MDYVENRYKRTTYIKIRLRELFLGYRGCWGVLSKADLAPEEIDILILATITPDMKVAATAAKVATDIGAINALHSTCKRPVLVSSTVCLWPRQK